MTDKYCGPCWGMVNGNGCAKADCPVRPPVEKPVPVKAASQKKGGRK
ncbi:MAG: hypothetical protein AAB262_11900 [Elusimicrobiota bacterium]